MSDPRERRRELRVLAAETVDGDGRVHAGETETPLLGPVGRPAARQRRVPAAQVRLPPRRGGRRQEPGRGGPHLRTAQSQTGDADAGVDCQKGEGVRRDAGHQLQTAGGDSQSRRDGQVPLRRPLRLDRAPGEPRAPLQEGHAARTPGQLDRRPRHIRLRGLRPQQQLRAAVHQLCQRASAVLLQSARVQVRAGGVPQGGHPVEQHRLHGQHRLSAAHRGQAQRAALSARRPVQVSLLRHL